MHGMSQEVEGRPNISKNKDITSFTNRTTFIKNIRPFQNSNGSLCHSNMVFVNPNKLNNTVIQPGNSTRHHLNLENKEAIKKSIAKVHINPNFKKRFLSDSRVSSCNLTYSITEVASNEPNCKKYSNLARSSLMKDFPPQSIQYMHDDVRKQTEQQCSVMKRNHKVFINPNYVIPSNPNSNSGKFPHNSSFFKKNGTIEILQCPVELKERSISKNAKGDSSLTQIKYSHTQEPKVDSCKKRKMYVDKLKIMKESHIMKRRKKSEDQILKPANKIFLNPKFEGRLQGINGICPYSRNGPDLNFVSYNIPVHTTHRGKINDERKKQSSVQALTSVLALPTKCSTGPDLIKQANTSNKKLVSQRKRTCSSSLVAVSATKLIHKRKSSHSIEQSSVQASTSVSAFSTKCSTGPDLIKQVNTSNKKLVSQRKRTCSSSLVAVSATKLIRKRKSSHSIDSKVKATLKNQPVFLSKTKLVRLAPNKVENNKVIVKPKIKRILSRDMLQLLTPDKITKLRKQSLTNSITNLVNVVPNCLSVTKIKSKNGKSLRLVRKNVESNKSKLESNANDLCSTQSKRNTLKQQLLKNTLCLVNKLRKTQFSKINVVQPKTKVSQSHSESKYVYKNNFSTVKQIQTKSVIGKATKKQYQNLKLKSNNYHSDKNKCIRSKYRIIKNQNYKTTNKSDCHRKDIKKLIQSPVVLSTSKLKSKMLNSRPKTTYTRKKLSIVNIGGIFYRCSRTSLTRNKSSPSKVPQKQGKGLLLNIRGLKFQFEDNGQTLRCLDQNSGRKRIDIGGVTFIRSSSGSSLTRTNYHTARSIILQAKQKRLSLLTRKLKKNNEPCPFYHRLGRCAGKDRGWCVRLHDPKYIAVCKKYIQGLCEDPKCLLSHKFSCHNMPTCQHFLAGHCGRDHCPYPHIKVSDNAPICLEFLRGFCSLGGECTKRHLEICPSFEKGTCPRGKYCPYPHPKSKSDLQLKGKFKHLEKKPQPPRNPEPVSNCNLRYFEDINLQKENMIILDEDLVKREECDSEDEEKPSMLKNRPRLGRLPSFIPLSLDNSCSDYNSEETKL